MAIPLFMLCITPENLEAVKEALPGVQFIQILGKDIGYDKEILITTPKPVPPAPVEAIPEDVVELPPAYEPELQVPAV